MMKPIVCSLITLMLSGAAVVWAEPLEPVKPQDQPTLQKPTIPDDDAGLSKPRPSRKSYAERYRETYSSDTFAKDYRENYRNNRIFLHSSDRLHRFLKDVDHLTGDSIDADADLDPTDTYKGKKDLNVPPAASDPGPEPLPAPNVVYQRNAQTGPVMRLPAQYYYAAARRLAEKQAAERARSATGETDSAAVQSAPDEIGPSASEPEAREAELKSAAEILAEQKKAMFASRNYFEAARRAEDMLNSKPDDVKLRYSYGVALFATGKYDAAAKAIQTAREQAHNAGIKLPAFSDYYSIEGDYRLHLRQLKRYVERTPGDDAAAALNDLIQSMEDAGEPAQ
ncbi:MAG: tetratricopeptide repeat protein [bacterium]|nr:tetratricopeptide repeat protein [bacterium]